MPMVWPHLYVIRPRQDLIARFDRLSPVPWFAQRHVWSLPAVGNHDHPNQMREAEEGLKWYFLAELATEEDEPEQSAAKDLLGGHPLRIETFDRHWELEPVGVFIHVATADALGATRLRAALSAAGSPGPSTWWLGQIERVEKCDAQRAAALAWALEELHRRFGALLQERCCGIDAPRWHELQTLRTAASAAGWKIDHHAVLKISVQEMDRYDTIELTFTIGADRRHRGLLDSPIRGTLCAKVQERDGRLEVTHGSMTLSTTTLLTGESPP